MAEHRGQRASVRRGLGVLAAGIVVLAMHRPVRAGLEDYVRKPDPAFAWTQISNHDTPVGKVYSLKLTSQVWQGITWTHSLSIYEPREITYPDTTLLFITGVRQRQRAQGRGSQDGIHPGPGLRRPCGRPAPGPQPTAARRQDRGRAHRRDVRPLPPNEGRELAPPVPDGQECREGHGRRPGVGQG